MSSRTIRKAIGVVKDQTSISIAKVVGNVAPDLEVLIVKATNHDNEPAEEKYIREILHLISQSLGYVSACVYNISKRLSKTHDWVVALKALMLVHRLLIDGDPVFGQEIMFASRKGARVLNMSDFRVEALSNYWDHSGFVKNYGMYLDQKLEFIAFERKLSGYKEFRDDHSYRIGHKSKSYGDLYESVTRTKVATTPIREMKPDRVLERLNKLLRLINKVLSCRPAGSAKTNKMVLVALYLVLKESFRIYADICEALGVLLDRFPEMEYANSVKTFDQYVNAAKTIDELVDFYTWSKDLGVAKVSAFPEVQKVTDKVLATLESSLREKKTTFEKDMEQGYKENGLSTPTTVIQTTEDLLYLEDDTVPPANHGNTLALALLSGPKTVENKSSWEICTYTGESNKTAAWQAPVVRSGKADWELALVDSASSITKQKVNISGAGLDPGTLNGMYDQGHMSYNQVGNSTRMRRTAKHVLALPAPKETVHPLVDSQDPFAASLMVPPPQYVQLADLEKKQSFLDQQVWQGHVSNGMLGQGQGQGHVSNGMLAQGHVSKINTGVASYNGMEQQAGYNYAHY